jgi:Icc-related predicted phosphoesterase
MIIKLISDLHIEFQKDGGNDLINLIPNNADILVIAGDFAPLKNYKKQINNHLDYLSTKFKHIIYVIGNHESFGQSIHQTFIDVINLNKNTPDNITIVASTKELMIDNQKFLITPLWYSWKIDNHLYESFIGDFTYIEKFNPWVYNENNTIVKWLINNLQEDDILVSHHLPSWNSVHPKFAGDSLNRFFVCDLEQDILQFGKPKLALHGHTHHSFDYIIHKTRVVCNPFGYANYETNPQFCDDFVIEI